MTSRPDGEGLDLCNAVCDHHHYYRLLWAMFLLLLWREGGSVTSFMDEPCIHFHLHGHLVETYGLNTCPIWDYGSYFSSIWADCQDGKGEISDLVKCLGKCILWESELWARMKFYTFYAPLK